VRWLLGGRPYGPILLCEFDTPKMRARGEKFDAHARAFFGCIAEIDHTAFLFFFGDGIDEHDFGAKRERFLQIEQAAVRVNDDGLAILAEFLTIAIFGHGAHRNSREDARTAAGCAVLWFAHGYLVSCIGLATESTMRTWKVSKKAGRKKLAEIAQGSVESRVLCPGTAVMRIYIAPENWPARELPSYDLGAP
jgi:hypothetical protein